MSCTSTRFHESTFDIGVNSAYALLTTVCNYNLTNTRKPSLLVYTALAPIILIFRSILFEVSCLEMNYAFLPSSCSVARFQRGAFRDFSFQHTSDSRAFNNSYQEFLAFVWLLVILIRVLSVFLRILLLEPSECSAFSVQPTAEPSITAIRSSYIENLCFRLFSSDSDSCPVSILEAFSNRITTALLKPAARKL